MDIDTGRYLVAGAHVAVAHSMLSLMDRGRVVAEDRRPHGATDPATVLTGLARRLPGLRDAHGAGSAALALGAATGHRSPVTGHRVDPPAKWSHGIPNRAGATCR
ncbi:hypothetical protein [Streptomyces wuyuanensis]|uniref:hypothetical protein n=1 Tax=Streptomyces wuyuanensis TaxID=1196353 RepID=UPI00115F9829|nr:hypothetical protein [Streptomyces wuyuanensis]